MAGIWNRIIPNSTESNFRISAHLLKAAVYLSVRGVFTNQQILNGINAKLSTPLAGQEITDLTNVLANAAIGTAIAKIDYLERFDALNIAAEMGVLTVEATYRTELNIVII